MGARHKNMLSVGGASQGGRRASHKGFSELMGLAKGIQENKNYDSEEEKQLHEVNYEIKKLIKEMESRKHEVPTQ
jgi:cysteine sulfinate desulfinase/cysteine desulfurase-like protein